MTTKQPLICDVYKSLKGDEMYLFISRQEAFERVPEGLKNRFHTEKAITSFVLTSDKRLARADAAKVMAAIEEQGFYLQMPPSQYQLPETEMKEVADRNAKLSR
jgi:uncharacterized protein